MPLQLALPSTLTLKSSCEYSCFRLKRKLLYTLLIPPPPGTLLDLYQPFSQDIEGTSHLMVDLIQ
jgi:hypothetical protein